MTSYEFSRSVRRDVLKRDIHRCVRCGRYLAEGAHLHHRKLRSQGGAGVVENAVSLDPLCHNWVHANVAAARATGLIVPGWADLEVTPVATWRGPMLLGVDGTFAVHSPAVRPAEW